MALDRSGAQVRVDPGATRRIFCADDCSPNLWRSRTLHSPARGHGSALNLKTGTKQHEFGTSLEPFRRPSVPWASVRVESRQIFKVLDGGRTRARTWDPLIKSQIFIAIFQRLTRKKYENHSISFQSLRPKKEKAFSERGEPISAAVGALAHSAAQRLADNGGAQLQAGCGT